MLRTSTSFHGMGMISDEKRVIGIIAQEDCCKKFFAPYQRLGVEDFKLCVKKGCKDEGNMLLLAHPDLKYYISAAMFSQVYQFLEEEFGQAHIFATKEKPYPLLFRATTMGKDYNGCAFMVAPCVF
jgi:hypothetical protein